MHNVFPQVKRLSGWTFILHNLKLDPGHELGMYYGIFEHFDKKALSSTT